MRTERRREDVCRGAPFAPPRRRLSREPWLPTLQRLPPVSAPDQRFWRWIHAASCTVLASRGRGVKPRVAPPTPRSAGQRGDRRSRGHLSSIGHQSRAPRAGWVHAASALCARGACRTRTTGAQRPASETVIGCPSPSARHGALRSTRPLRCRGVRRRRFSLGVHPRADARVLVVAHRRVVARCGAPRPVFCAVGATPRLGTRRA